MNISFPKYQLILYKTDKGHHILECNGKIMAQIDVDDKYISIADLSSSNGGPSEAMLIPLRQGNTQIEE